MATLENVKVGDEVIISSGQYSKRGNFIAKVERVTKTQFTAAGIRFTKYGNEIGGSDHWGAFALIATPELIEKVAAEHRYTKALEQVRRSLQTIETLWREIDRNNDYLKSTQHLLQSLPHLQSAIQAINPSEEVNQ